MATFIVFLRAINVGGRFVKMEALRGHLEKAGFGDVETHIQSGNVRLSSRVRSTAKVEEAVEAALQESLGFVVKAIVRTPGELAAVVRDAPPDLLGADSGHYAFFLKSKPEAAATAVLDSWAAEGERMRVIGRDVHLWLSDSFHKAKASNARVERVTGLAATARDWKVVSALAEKWGAHAAP